jgi:DNA-binding CsgD family transcriptional regulator
MKRRQLKPPANHSVYGMALSPREEQIVRLMCEGFAPYEIAAQWQCIHQTIFSHRRRIYEKTGCRTDVQLGVWAVRHGLIK